MRSAAACQAAEAAASILSALRAGDARRLNRELDRVGHLRRGAGKDSWAEEKNELLEGVVSCIRERLAAGSPPHLLEPQAELLGHLAALG